ncbi:hypothetical protein ACFYVL_31640 [Streptomyces sp. NPDC004111]|uniref:hypothetical protein n=1 Tax=Streptomyces sp. NPDC004111 TaxID=3364690 RepID=UPI003695740D
MFEDRLNQWCRAAGKAIRARVSPRVDTRLAAIDVAAVVFTVRESFARRHVLAEARRHLMETLRGRAFPPGLDNYIADAALYRHARQTTEPQEGRPAPTADRLVYTAGFALPHRWWIAAADGKPPRESSLYERAQVASLALQNAIRDARIRHDHPDRDTALAPAQQAAMPQEYPQGRTTDPATWLRSPKNMARLGALTRASEARRRDIEDREAPAPAPTADRGDPHRQEHELPRQPHPGHGPGVA